jgi:flagellar biosynthesis/type III secretory pathway protein FliH
LAHYLSSQEKENVMNTYQAFRQEGRQEGLQEGLQTGEKRKARLSVLRGRQQGASVEFLAKQLELPYAEVENIIKGYDEVYQFWTNKQHHKNTLLEVAHLSEQEVRYLMDLFSQKLN